MVRPFSTCTFIGRGYGQVSSYVHTTAMGTKGQCHVYSLPYEFKFFIDLTLAFPGGMFSKIRHLLMIDKHPFEHEFFELISHECPVLEYLRIFNTKPQENKQRSSSLLTFSNLKILQLQSAHPDYAEQFLLEKNAYLPRLELFFIKYESLAIVTDNFTNDTERLKFSKLRKLSIREYFVLPEKFYQYFPKLTNCFSKEFFK